MGIRRGSISTPIIADGLVFNMDAANRASYIPNTSTTFNTTDISISGTFENNTSFNNSDPKSWDFDGVDDRINMGHQEFCNFDRYDPYSLIVWVNPDSVSGNQSLIAQLSTGAGWILTSGGTGIIFAHIRTQGGGNQLRVDSDAGQFAAGVWAQYVATYNGNSNTSGCQLYKNGVAITTNSVYNNLTLSTTTGAGIDLTLGTRYTDQNDYDGKIANAQIYNRALSANEVLHNYNALKSRFGL